MLSESMLVMLVNGDSVAVATAVIFVLEVVRQNLRLKTYRPIADIFYVDSYYI